MTRYVAFLRAINVAGHASVRMSDVKDAFESAGCEGVRTYIQSGNVIFESSTVAVFRKTRGRLRTLLGDDARVLFRTAGELERMVVSNPFKDFEVEPGVKL